MAILAYNPYRAIRVVNCLDCNQGLIVNNYAENLRVAKLTNFPRIKVEAGVNLCRSER